MNKKFLVLYTSVGLGHKYIAMNIMWHLKKFGYQVQSHDILQVEEGVLSKVGILLHSFINRRLPFFWQLLYFSKFINLIGLPLRVQLAAKNSSQLESVIANFSPDVIITTQTTASAVVAYLKSKNKYLGKLVVAFSDYHLHKFWLYDQTDLYLVNIEKQKQEMLSLGIPESKIIVGGITLQPMVKHDRALVLEEFNLPKNKNIVLLASGSLGIGFPKELLFSFAKNFSVNFPEHVLAVACGKNELLYKELQSKSYSEVYPINFTENLNKLYQHVSLILTKPGGLTIAECLQAGTKILITHTLPGQEVPNYDYLISEDLVYSKPHKMNLQNLNTALEQALSNKKTSEHNQASNQITQFGREGEVLKQAISKLLHDV